MSIACRSETDAAEALAVGQEAVRLALAGRSDEMAVILRESDDPYSWSLGSAPLATVANDGTWRVDIPSGALGGTTDVSIAQLPSGVFQCAIPSATNPVSPSCVRVAAPGKKIPHSYDPRVQRVFRQWLPVFTDRQAALSVTAAQPLAGSTGSCFSIDSISASLSAPVDVGIYCYADDGLLTAARVSFGTVTIVVGALVLLLWIPLRQKPGLGTVSNVVVVGVAADVGLWLIPAPDQLAVRIVMMISAVVLNGLAGAVYIGSQLGPGPRDGLMTGLAARTGRSLRLVRIGIELTVLLIGLALGGTVGIATVAFALLVGYCLASTLRLFELAFARRAGAVSPPRARP
jgi:uncharacterized membrane protein YczE